MSSSQHSTRSTPKWRSSLSNPKRQRPATSVSLVFAQPEQGSKLASAIDKLPVAAIDDAASFMSQASRKRERTQSQASSFVATVGQREEQTSQPGQGVQPETQDVSRKRSKLSLEVPEPAAPAIAVSSDDCRDTQGSASNPVDLTESPQSSSSLQQPTAGEDAGKCAELLSPTTSVPFPITEPQKSVRASKSTPTRSSWFGFSRANADSGSSTPAQAQSSQHTHASPSVEIPTEASPSTHYELPIPKGDSGAQGDADLSSPTSPQRIAMGTPPQSIPSNGKPSAALSYTPTQYSPPNHRMNSNTTSISSVDEEVPRPRFTSMDNATAVISPHAIVESQVAKAANRKPSISSLNPSSSRFTLKLPLLGRPKIPLEQAVAVAQAEDIREPLKPTEDSAVVDHHAGGADTLVQSANTDVGRADVSAAPHTAQEGLQRAASSEEASPQSPESAESANREAGGTHEKRAASWWDYLGWGGQHPQGDNASSEPAKNSANQEDSATHGDDQPPASSASDTSQAQQPESSKAVEAPAPSVAPEPSAPVAKADVSSPVHATGAQDPRVDNATAKPASVFSAETAKSQVSVWYSPWAWYTTSSPEVASAAHGDQNGDAPGSSSEPTAGAKTESEMVKEEALSRSENAHAEPSEPTKTSGTPTQHPSSESTSQPQQDVSNPAPESPNPVESSVANNKSGWMSFFMSKALTVKSITNESHDQKEDGMEVMEIDDEPQPSAAIAIPTDKSVQGVAAASPLKASSTAASSPVPPPTPKSPASKAPAHPPPKEREPRKPDPPAAPLTDSESIKRDTTKGGPPRSPSPTPSKGSGTTPPNSARTPNFVLPTWEDTFHSPPRSYTPPRHQGPKSKLTGALSYVTGALFSKDDRPQGKGKGKEREAPVAPPEFLTFGQELPKALDIVGEPLNPYILNGGCRVVVIGVAGWSPGAVTRTLAGGLPSPSSKFVNMTAQALEQFAEENGFKFKKITRMALEGDGTIRKKVSRVYNHLMNNEEWMEDLHAADVIFVASHSQGAIIATHLIDRLIEDGHILTSRSVDVLAKSAATLAAGGASAMPATQAQKVCLLTLCGIHLGPLRYLKTSSLLQPYIQYLENAAARELFEFQDTESKLSKNYIGALRNVMDHGAKAVYIASLNDQVVPIYSGLFTAASHPRILRALYIDNDAYHSSDFLSNLLILLIRILNAGLSDRGLLAHLSEATAGTLSGVGHSTAYEEPATYSLAVKYFFMTNDGANADAELVINPFNAVEEQNDYEIPWLLRDMIADTKIAHFFAREFSQLRDAFDDWQPKTTILREVKKKLQPITRLSTIPLPSNSISRL
ncbi:hypothetical protein GY45DRAFT_1280990 [Cubamyces sp. BRFM 1775]|nr:hypothetical protein GY45DRAFT_1280990 [Cubamyces sp. BRFM 1775]